MEKKTEEQERWEAWRALPTTQEFFQRFLPLAQLSLMEQWANGGFDGDNSHQDAVLSAAARGEYRSYQRLRDLTWEAYQETIDDQE
jgi:hypothetical protein